jgi:hypothetical protein
MHRLHFKYDYQAAILENQLRAITPELMAGSTPNHLSTGYIYLLGIFYGFFTRGEHYGPDHFIASIRANPNLGYRKRILLNTSSMPLDGAPTTPT